MVKKPRTKKLPEIQKPERNENQKIISYSQYSKWRTCPHSWKLSYVDKIKIQDKSIHLIFGTAIHECLQEWITMMFEKTVKEANEIDFTTILLERLKFNYKKEFESSGQHFSSKEEIAEFYADGLAILEWVKKKRSHYFSPKDQKLVGVEIPILLPPDKEKPNVLLMGFLDLVIYEEFDDMYVITDIKTSTKGWRDYDKKNKTKISQVLLYKKYFSEQYNIPIEKIRVEYFIVRRKIDEDSEFPQKRVQQFKPSQGSVSMNAMQKEFQEFLDICFISKGEYNTEIEYPAITGDREWNCRFCEYNSEEYCPRSNRKITI